MTTIATGQLALWREHALADDLRDRRRVSTTGAERLLVELVRRGLEEQALAPAAALVLELDRPRGEDE